MRQLGRAWWVFLVTGILWFMISLVVLRFDITSIATVGVLLGALFIIAGVNEFLTASAREGWKWAHITMGVLFVIGGIAAFVRPVNAFWALAAILGFLLLFKGSLDIITSVAAKQAGAELWWLPLVTGIIEILLAFWASQSFFPARAELILLWAGFASMFRGFGEIALAFELRRVSKAV
jgi:uncharacterized membrane protein HdeD (DUF308 family)